MLFFKQIECVKQIKIKGESRAVLILGLVGGRAYTLRSWRCGSLPEAVRAPQNTIWNPLNEPRRPSEHSLNMSVGVRVCF